MTYNISNDNSNQKTEGNNPAFSQFRGIPFFNGNAGHHIPHGIQEPEYWNRYDVYNQWSNKWDHPHKCAQPNKNLSENTYNERGK